MRTDPDVIAERQRMRPARENTGAPIRGLVELVLEARGRAPADYLLLPGRDPDEHEAQARVSAKEIRTLAREELVFPPPGRLRVMRKLVGRTGARNSREAEALTELEALLRGLEERGRAQ